MKVKNYFPNPPDFCERLISGLEYCINVEEIEIDEDEILYSMLEKGLFYRGMFQQFTNLTLVRQIELLLENFNEFESALWIPKIEITLTGLTSEIPRACSNLIFKLGKIFSKEQSYSILVGDSVDIYIFHIVKSIATSVLHISSDLEYTTLDKNCSVHSVLETYLSPRIGLSLTCFRVLIVFPSTPHAQDCVGYENQLQTLRKLQHITSIQTLRQCLNELRQYKEKLCTPSEPEIFDKEVNQTNESRTFGKAEDKFMLRDSFVQDLLKSTESEDLAAFGLRAYQALRENIIAQTNWEDENFYIDEENGEEEGEGKGDGNEEEEEANGHDGGDEDGGEGAGDEIEEVEVVEEGADQENQEYQEYQNIQNIQENQYAADNGPDLKNMMAPFRSSSSSPTSENNQSDTDEYVFVEENGQSRFQRLTQEENENHKDSSNTSTRSSKSNETDDHSDEERFDEERLLVPQSFAENVIQSQENSIDQEDPRQFLRESTYFEDHQEEYIAQVDSTDSHLTHTDDGDADHDHDYDHDLDLGQGQEEDEDEEEDDHDQDEKTQDTSHLDHFIKLERQEKHPVAQEIKENVLKQELEQIRYDSRPITTLRSTPVHSPVKSQDNLKEKPNVSAKPEQGVDIQTLLGQLSLIAKEITADRSLRQEKKSQRRMKLGKELFLRMQASAAAAKRAKQSQQQIRTKTEIVPPLPNWMDNVHHLSSPKIQGSTINQLPVPVAATVTAMTTTTTPTPSTDIDIDYDIDPPTHHHSTPLPSSTSTSTSTSSKVVRVISEQGKSNHVPKDIKQVVSSQSLQSQPPIIVEDSTTIQRDQIIRQRVRQHALNQWKEQNVEKQVTTPSTSNKIIENDNSTVVSAVSQQSSFSAGAKSVSSHPKAAKIVIAAIDETDSKAEEEEQRRRLQKFEMLKKKKADEAAEREKNRQGSKPSEQRDKNPMKTADGPSLKPQHQQHTSHRGPIQSPGYLHHHLEQINDDEQILKLENEVALLNPASVKSSKSINSIRRNSSADPSARRPQSTHHADGDKSHQRSQSANRANRSVGNGRANAQQIRNALTAVCLAGPHQAPLREETLSAMDNYLEGEGSLATQFLIVMHQSKMLSFKCLYIVDGTTSEIRRLSGRGPRILPLDVIEEYYKYESSTRSFRKLPTLSFNSTCDAVTVNPTKIKKLGQKDR